MVITADTIDIHVGGFSVADSLITTQVFNRPWYQYNSCTGQIIDTLTSLPHLTLLAPGIHVFPNPAQEKITITFTEPFMDGTLTLYDIHGNKVREEKPETQLSLDWNLNELRSGIYVLCFRTGTGVYSQRILKID
jgi:hypothetical protein